MAKELQKGYSGCGVVVGLFRLRLRADYRFRLRLRLRPDAKYKINNTLIVERVSAVRAKKETSHFLLTLASFLRTEDPYSSYLSYLPDRICLPPPKKRKRLPDRLFVEIMLVRSRSVASSRTYGPCLSRDRRSYRSSLIAEKNCSTLACVTGNAASVRLQSRTAVG